LRVQTVDAYGLYLGLAYVTATRFEPQSRELARRATELLSGLVQVIAIEVGIAERVDELARLQIGHLGDHLGQQGVGRDVERHTEEDVARALVELAGQPPLGAAEPDQRMAWRQRHPVQIGDVPRADDVSP